MCATGGGVAVAVASVMQSSRDVEVCWLKRKTSGGEDLRGDAAGWHEGVAACADHFSVCEGRGQDLL